MGIPGGVVTVLVDALPATSAPVLSAAVSVTPTRELQWAATGQSLNSMCGAGPMQGWVTLPACDQVGWVTPDTQVGTTGWLYLVTTTWTQSDGTQHSASGQISCLSNQTVDYLINVGGVLQPPSPGFPGTAVALLVMPSAQYSALPVPDPYTLYFTY